MSDSVKLRKSITMVEAVKITAAMKKAGATVLGHMICEGCPYDILAAQVYEAMRPLEPASRKLVKP